MYKKKVTLLGATGMAGHVVYHYLNETNKYDITNIVYRNKLNDDSLVVDITQQDLIKKALSDSNPDIIINCIGVLIKGSLEYPDNAIYINAYFPHFLKRISDEINAKLIHISTDCVFSGKKGFYSENDFRDADDIYGRSKALGEIINDKDLTLRTSIIGPELKKNGEGLFHWLMSQNGKIKGYVNAKWGGVTTLELAKIIDLVIEQGMTGLVHLSNGEAIDKYELLKLIKRIWNKQDIEIIPDYEYHIDKSIKKSQKLNYNVASYEQMLVDLYQWMLLHKTFYNLNYKL